jgi:arylsulfatase A-like enzyme
MIQCGTHRVARFAMLIAALFLGWHGPRARGGERSPNVVVILIDDLGWRDLGCYGSTYYRTPNIDRLAKAGVLFSDAYAACPVCSPTRAALLTGKYPARLHLTDWLAGRPDRPDQKLLRPHFNQHLPLEEVTLAKVLRSAGYVTGHIGKWHLGGPNYDALHQGFDISIGGEQGSSPKGFFAPFKTDRGSFLPGLAQAADGEYLTDRLTTEAERFIECNRDRPFFLYLAHYAVHIPLQAKPGMAAKYKANRPAGEQNNPVYAAVIESVDEGVGRLISKLDSLHLSSQTIVFFTSDNGGLSVREGPNTPATSNAPLRAGKGYLYEGGIRVPLLVCWPGVIPAGAVRSVPVSSIDFFPTILEMCGVKNRTPIDGTSITQAIVHGKDLRRDALYWHYPHYSNQGGRPGSAVRSGNYKLIEFFEDGRRELFDLKTDIGESHNLVEKCPEVAESLARKLERWRSDVKAQMMLPNPHYRPASE